MQGKFAVIGYGSLIWDLEVLEPHVSLPWHMGGGPRMPMEFSRISPKRLMGLVVVLDAEHGVACATHAVPSRRESIHAAAEDLRERERSPSIDFIGAVCLQSGFQRAHSPAIAEVVRAWCEEHEVSGAVWTDLPKNFAEHAGEPFSLEAARRYLRTLEGDSLAEAVRYIDNAPVETATPLRALLATDDWWLSLPREA